MDRSICKECSLTLPSFNGMCKIKLNNSSSFDEYAVVDDPVVVVASKSFSKAVTELRRRVRFGGLMVLSDLMFGSIVAARDACVYLLSVFGVDRKLEVFMLKTLMSCSSIF